MSDPGREKLPSIHLDMLMHIIVWDCSVKQKAVLPLKVYGAARPAHLHAGLTAVVSIPCMEVPTIMWSMGNIAMSRMDLAICSGHTVYAMYFSGTDSPNLN